MNAGKTIRFESKHREAVFNIACDTACFGDPVELFLEDRRLFFDSFYRYYTDIDDANSFVAVINGQVVGFLMGCLDSFRQERWFRKNIVFMILKSMTGRYRLGVLTLRYFRRSVEGYIRREYPSCDVNEYPSHLHINMDSNWRGRGIGTQLMERYLSHLRSMNLPGVHLNTSDMNIAACRLYENLGFQVLSSRPTTVWKDIINHPVTNICYGLRL